MLDVLAASMTEPSARGLADAFSRAVRDGTIVPAQRLPSIRATAKALDLSPTTVSSAWRILQQANLIFTDGARGTTVASGAGQGPVRFGSAIQFEANFAVNLSSGLPDPSLLPDLGPSLLRVAHGPHVESFLATPIVAELEERIRSDWPVQTDVVTISDGVTDALDLITMTLLRFGDRVAVENPTYPPLLDLMDAAGVRTIPLEIDSEGPTVESLANAVAEGAQMVFLQCRAHDPLGVALSEERADVLAHQLRNQAVVVVELDLWGPLSSFPLTSLSSRLSTQTIHVRGYSDSHGPDLRLAALGGPTELLERLISRRHLGQGWTSRLLQRVLLDLLSHEEPQRAVEAARETYRLRREALRTELEKLDFRVIGDDGPTIWLPVQNEAVALMILASQGIGVAPGAPYLVKSDGAGHIAISSNVLPPEQAPQIAAAVAKAARPSSVGSLR